MTGIQLILTSGVLILVLYFIFRLRSAFFDMLVILLLSGLAVFFILDPQYTNILAHKLGVGRGADLVFYISILFFLFLILKLFARIRRLEKTVTELVRQLAKNEVQYGTSREDDK